MHAILLSIKKKKNDDKEEKTDYLYLLIKFWSLRIVNELSCFLLQLPNEAGNFTHVVGKRIVEDKEALFHTHWLSRDDLSLAFSAKLLLWKFRFLQLVKKRHNHKGEIWCVAHSLISGLVFTIVFFFCCFFFFQFNYFFFFFFCFFLAFFNYFLYCVMGRSIDLDVAVWTRQKSKNKKNKCILKKTKKNWDKIILWHLGRWLLTRAKTQVQRRRIICSFSHNICSDFSWI